MTFKWPSMISWNSSQIREIFFLKKPQIIQPKCWYIMLRQVCIHLGYQFGIFNGYPKILLRNWFPVHPAELIHLVNQLLHLLRIFDNRFISWLQVHFNRQMIGFQHIWQILFFLFNIECCIILRWNEPMKTLSTNLKFQFLNDIIFICLNTYVNFVYRNKCWLTELLNEGNNLKTVPYMYVIIKIIWYSISITFVSESNQLLFNLW